MLDDLISRLKKRAEIRRQIPNRKSVLENQPDRLADLLDEAAQELDKLASASKILEDDMRRYLYDRDPERRIKCLEKFRETMGLSSWGTQKSELDE